MHIDHTNAKPSLCDQHAIALFARRFAAMTEHSSHTYERSVHKLLGDLAEYRRQDVLSGSEYEAIVGTAVDVMQYFNLDVRSLAVSDDWYRASVIHQMGQGMLQAMRTLHEELTLDVVYQDALSGLGIGRRAAHLHTETAASAPITCHKWANGRTHAQEHVNASDRYDATRKTIMRF